jgi:hypothetical protein
VLDAPIMLLLDGHGSHVTLHVCKAAYRNWISTFCLPPKTTHEPQLVDVGVFGFVQEAWKKVCKESVQNGEPVNKATTIAKYMIACDAGMHSTAIMDTWHFSGHHLSNPNIFTNANYAPSKVTSTLAHFPPLFLNVKILATHSNPMPLSSPTLELMVSAPVDCNLADSRPVTTGPVVPNPTYFDSCLLDPALLNSPILHPTGPVTSTPTVYNPTEGPDALEDSATSSKGSSGANTLQSITALSVKTDESAQGMIIEFKVIIQLWTKPITRISPPT